MENKSLTHGPRTPLDEVKASLLYLKSLGLQGVECTDEAVQLLRTIGRVAPPADSRGEESRGPKPNADRRPRATGPQGQKAHGAASMRPPVGTPAPKPPRTAGDAVRENAPAARAASDRVMQRPPVEPVVDTLESIRKDLGECTRCGLFRGRSRIVFGTGNPRARLMFVGDMPLAEEDRAGEPFLGASGALLNKMIQAMGFSRDDVYLSNILKCCPGPQQGRPDMSVCLSFLERQIAAVRPEVICALGAVAAQTLLGITSGIGGIRGQFQNYKGIRLMPTFHPAFLLRHPERKRQAWQDLQQVMAVLKTGDRQNRA